MDKTYIFVSFYNDLDTSNLDTSKLKIRTKRAFKRAILSPVGVLWYIVGVLWYNCSVTDDDTDDDDDDDDDDG